MTAAITALREMNLRDGSGSRDLTIAEERVARGRALGDLAEDGWDSRVDMAEVRGRRKDREWWKGRAGIGI